MYLMEYPFAYRIPYSILSYIYIHTHTYTLKIPFIQDLVEYPIDMPHGIPCVSLQTDYHLKYCVECLVVNPIHDAPCIPYIYP